MRRSKHSTEVFLASKSKNRNSNPAFKMGRGNMFWAAVKKAMMAKSSD